ncbi:lysine--tRNA ligase [Patescibacteria group bacterium]|nr:lysine--tRNA ligase [Patescibacteria group bacterium]
MLEDIIRERKKKLEKWSLSHDPYPPRVKRTTSLNEVVKVFSSLEKTKKKVYVTGRVAGLRDQGNIIFADLKDESGSIQLVLSKKETKYFSDIKESLDSGDFISVAGPVFKTKKGEKSILAKEASIISKSLRPMPKEWYGLEDIETKLRKRYLDSALNHEVRGIFLKKSLFWKTVRDFLVGEDFLEVENTVLESVPGGAEAEPFVTHMNALDEDFYMRISLELPLKKMLVGGFEKVFEIGRIFRNEGIDREHLQDYTQMEVYWAYADYNDMMALMEKLFKKIVKNIRGSMESKKGDLKINWSKKWPKVEYFDLFKKYTGLDLEKASVTDLQKKAKDLKLEFKPADGRGRLIDLIYKKTVRPNLIQPCFLVNPPVEVEPLAKRVPGNPGRVERFQIVAAGTELGKGFSELNDPLDQRKRFEEQAALREKGDKEAQMMNEDFVEALEYGMPPAAGFGMSERVFAVLMDMPVREAVYFPLMRREN